MSGGIYDQNSISSNPLFVDPASNDFRLKSNSPAISTLGFKAAWLIGPSSLSAVGNEIGNSTAPVLTDDQLTRAVREATQRWQATGIDTSLLNNTTVSIAALDNNILGQANSVIIDTNAAGYGWYLDDDYATNDEFENDHAPKGLDLLTTVMHEFGHVLGLRHSNNGGDLMNATLGVGKRYSPEGYASSLSINQQMIQTTTFRTQTPTV